MKLIYIAGPYSAPTTVEVFANVQRARERAAEVAQLGAFPVVPHLLGAALESIGDYAYWCAATLEVCRRCDALLTVERWGESRGAMGEVREMRRLDKPVFHSTAALAHWLSDPKAP